MRAGGASCNARVAFCVIRAEVVMGRVLASIFVLGLALLIGGLIVAVPPIGPILVLAGAALFAVVVVGVFALAWRTKGWSWLPWREPGRNDR